MSDRVYEEAEAKKTLAEDKALAGDIYPSCPCFKHPVGESVMHSNMSATADYIHSALQRSGVCDPAVPYFLAQAVAIVLAQVGTRHGGAAAEAAGMNDERILRATEDEIAKMTAQFASLVPKLVAAHCVTVRRQTAILGEMAVAAVRVDPAPEGAS